jgi:hypothetical protein
VRFHRPDFVLGWGLLPDRDAVHCLRNRDRLPSIRGPTPAMSRDALVSSRWSLRAHGTNLVRPPRAARRTGLGLAKWALTINCRTERFRVPARQAYVPIEPPMGQLGLPCGQRRRDPAISRALARPLVSLHPGDLGDARRGQPRGRAPGDRVYRPGERKCGPVTASREEALARLPEAARTLAACSPGAVAEAGPEAGQHSWKTLRKAT